MGLKKSPFEIRRAVNAAARTDFYTFAQLMYSELYGSSFDTNWHLEAISYALDKVAAGKCKRLLITVPPRSLKSTLCSILFPAYLLGRDPRKKIICASYSDVLTKDFSRQSRKVLGNLRFRELFGDILGKSNKDSESYFVTNSNGFRFATSAGATLTGMGGSLIIIDDPMKASDAHSNVALDKVERWFRETVLSRLDNKQNDAIVIVMQRLNVADLAGIVMDMEGWEHIDLPAIATDDEVIPVAESRFYHRRAGEVLLLMREPLHVLEEIKRNIGSYAFEAQYQQRPYPPQGNLVKRSWFRRCPRVEVFPQDRIVLSIDPAMTIDEQSSYSAAVVFIQRGEDVYVYEVRRVRYEFPEVLRFIKDLHYKFHRLTGDYALVVEKGGSGISLSQVLRQEGIRPIEIDPEGDKYVRLNRQCAKIEAGHVWLPEEADWLFDFEAELFAFPSGKFDDQVDAFSQGLDRIFFKKGRSFGGGTVGVRGTI